MKHFRSEVGALSIIPLIMLGVFAVTTIVVVFSGRSSQDIRSSAYAPMSEYCRGPGESCSAVFPCCAGNPTCSSGTCPAAPSTSSTLPVNAPCGSAGFASCTSCAHGSHMDEYEGHRVCNTPPNYGQPCGDEGEVSCNQCPYGTVETTMQGTMCAIFDEENYNPCNSTQGSSTNCANCRPGYLFANNGQTYCGEFMTTTPGVTRTPTPTQRVTPTSTRRVTTTPTPGGYNTPFWSRVCQYFPNYQGCH